MTILENLSNVEDTTLDGVKQAQDVALKVTKTLVDAVAGYVPDYDRPFADRLPTATQAVDNLFDFLGELLKVNRSFAHQVIDAVAPLTGEDKPVAKPAAKPAPKVKAADAA
ncbi:MAG: hypothetical protein QOE35_3050 [Actinomycetota bacterium]|jgi:hypothetical protein